MPRDSEPLPKDVKGGRILNVSGVVNSGNNESSKAGYTPP